MTSVCAGGVASQPRAGVPTRIYLDTEFMSSILPAPLVWLRPFLPYLPPFFLDVAAFCAGEPPAQPNLVEDTMAAVLAGGEFGAALVAAELIQQAIQNQLWYQICECVSGTQPTAPTGQSAPAGLVQINPPTVVAPGPLGPCMSVASQQKVFNDTTAVILIGANKANGLLNQPLPSGATTLHGVYANQVVGGSPKGAIYVVEFYDSAGTFVSAFFPTAASGATTTRDDAIPSTARYIYVDVSAGTVGANTNTADVHLTVFCGTSGPGTPAVPCCPPDPIITGMLTQILNYVTTIQRQAVPFGYVVSTVHAGLSGAGALSISGLLGIKVALTTLPSAYGVAGTSPPEHFDLGFVTFGTADGFPSAFRLTRNPQVMMPARCSVYTDLDYDLAPGVVVTITELVREP